MRPSICSMTTYRGGVDAVALYLKVGEFVVGVWLVLGGRHAEDMVEDGARPRLRETRNESW